VSHIKTVFFVPLLCAQLFARHSTGRSWNGNDSSSASLRGAQVTLINIGTDERRQSQTDGEGSYQFLNLVRRRIGWR